MPAGWSGIGCLNFSAEREIGHRCQLLLAGAGEAEAAAAALAARAAFNFSMVALWAAASFFSCYGRRSALVSLSNLALWAGSFVLSPLVACKSSSYLTM